MVPLDPNVRMDLMTERDLGTIPVPRPPVPGGHLRHCNALFAQFGVLVLVSVWSVRSRSFVSSSSAGPAAAMILERALIIRIIAQSPMVGFDVALDLLLMPGL